MSQVIRACYVCGGDMTRGVTTYLTETEGRVLVFENVSATICSRCGERSFAGEVIDEIMRLAAEPSTPTRVTKADVYDLARSRAGRI